MPYKERRGQVPLGSWLVRQRQAHEDGKLPEAVREALHDLGVTWLKEGSALT